jgi:hypothetical protein
MAIEIKELVVRIVVDEPASKKDSVVESSPKNLDQLKDDIIKKCTREVLEKIKEQQER